MGRHKIPTQKKIIQGTFRKERENPDEPMPTNPLGKAPDFLTKQQKEAWAEISRLAPSGVLKDADRIIVEIAARLLAELRVAGLSVGNQSHLMNCLGRMGMDPSNRSKVFSENSGRKKDPWEKFGGK